MITVMRSVSVSLLLASFSLAQTPAQKKPWETMDYGPFHAASVTMPWSKDFVSPDGITLKGLSIRLGKDAAVCFDTATLRYAAGWSGGFLKLMGTPFEGTHRPPEQSRPAVQGTLRWRTPGGPGWSKSGDFKDPRAEPYVPISPETGRYRGLYVHGDRVALSYRAWSCTVLETPGFQGQDGVWAFTRTFRIGPSPDPLTLLVCEVEGQSAQMNFPAEPQKVFALGETAAGVGPGIPAGSAWEITGGRIHLKLPALPAPVVFKLLMGSGKKADLSAHAKILAEPTQDPEPLTKGGPVRFAQAVETKGALGTAGGAYEVDTLTLPDTNPWNSWMRIGGLDFFPDGRAALSTWSGDVWIVSGIDGKLEKLSWRRFATGLYQPLGLRIVEGVIYALGRDQITRLHDLNGDGEADFYENFNNHCAVTPNFHEFALDLHTDPGGNFYYTKGAPLLGTQEWDPVSSHSGCLLMVSKDGQKLEVFATGLRAPNGSSVGPNGEVTCSDNEGIWVPTSRLNWVRKGSFLGAVGMHHAAAVPTDYERPLCWIPHKVDNSSAGQVWVASDRWGPFQGRLLHLSYGTCSLFSVLMERVGDQVQGGVVRFPLSFASGIMRARFHPQDGQLYVAGLKGWQTSAARDGAFQRVRYTGKPVHMVHEMRATSKGIDLAFTSPLDPASAANVENYSLQWWNYAWTRNYGSPEFSPSEPARKGRDDVPIKAIRVSADGKSVSLEVAGMRPVMQTQIRLKVKAADGTAIAQDVYGTINRLP